MDKKNADTEIMVPAGKRKSKKRKTEKSDGQNKTTGDKGEADTFIEIEVSTNDDEKTGKGERGILQNYM